MPVPPPRLHWFATAVFLAFLTAVSAAATAEDRTAGTQADSPVTAEAAVAGDAEIETGKIKDIDETLDLPEYPLGARIAMGEEKTYTVGEEDTFLDIARYFGLGYVELRAANPDIDPWAPVPGTEVVIPSFQLLPRARQRGIVVNLGKMRLYHFRYPGKEPVSYPIGIGAEGLATPTGETKIVRKKDGPSWYPTPRMREQKKWLPQSVPPGASNPLGTHALYLGWPTFLIHGSNKPWGIGRRVSSGCMRMYPEDIVELFGIIPVGTPVTIVDQPILIGWLDDGLYLEANPSQTQSLELEMGSDVTPKPVTDKLRRMIENAAGPAAGPIDWGKAEQALRERNGIPVRIATARKTKDTETKSANRAPPRTVINN